MNKLWEDLILRDNPNCKKTDVLFGILGELLNPEEIESKLKIKADFSYAKDRVYYWGGKPKVNKRQGTWQLHTEGKLSTTSVEKHFLYLLDRLEPVKEEIIAITEKYSLITYFNCSYTFTLIPGGPTLSPKTVKRIASLKAYLSFYLQEYEEDDEY